MNARAIELINFARMMAGSFDFKILHRTSPNHFSREGGATLTFERVIGTILHMVKKAISIEILNVFYDADIDAQSPARQTFTESREKVSFKAFAELFQKSCDMVANNPIPKLFKGYRIFASDGTSFIVGKMGKALKYFGDSTTVAGKAMCRIGCIVDILDNAIVDAVVAPFSKGERAIAIEQIQRLKHIENALFLFDRGY
jgi:hypothetical protein